MTFIALFRGVNVSGKNRLPMAEIPAVFEACGCSEVRTYIQSGNVVARAPERDLAKLPARITAAVATAFGHAPVVVLRSAPEWRKVLDANPFAVGDPGEKALHVMFLADMPAPERVASLDPNRSPGDDYVVHGREIYLCARAGLGNSKLTNAYFDAKLKTTSTVRNWRTVATLAEIAGA